MTGEARRAFAQAKGTGRAWGLATLVWALQWVVSGRLCNSLNCSEKRGTRSVGPSELELRRTLYSQSNPNSVYSPHLTTLP